MADTATTLGLGKVLPVTGSFAIPLVVASSLLSLNVVKTRIDLNTWEGDKTIGGKDGAGVKQPDGNTYDPLLLATRIHANMIENLPLTLVLSALAEINGADRKKLTTILATFTVVRVLHVIGLGKANQPCRAAGMLNTIVFTRCSSRDSNGFPGYFGTQFVQLGLVGWLGLLMKDYWGF